VVLAVSMVNPNIYRGEIMWKIRNGLHETLWAKLEFLYGTDEAPRVLERLTMLFTRYSFLEQRCCLEKSYWDEASCLLITYGDMVQQDGETPLLTLKRFLDDYLKRQLSIVHVLPFFPYSSDDGFAVIDYRRVDENLGSWEDIEQLAENFKLMFDLVLNHVSSRSDWFENYIGGIAPAREYFLETAPDADINMVVRPRTTPLLSSVHTVFGKKHVWTTFGPDQVDLNFANPDVLLEMLDILFDYISRGATIIRLDAIAYIWKEIGTPCINLPPAHQIVKLFRDIFNVIPGVLLLTETNLPHQENISYFGEGDEAHLVYQFSLPPLILHTMQSGSSRHLQDWSSTLKPPPPGCSFLNFTASHDGIGVRPLEGLLDQEEIDTVVDKVRKCGGLVSSRRDENGREVPYELNITWFDAMGGADQEGLENVDIQIRKFLCSQSIMLTLRGIPAVYFHSLTGSANNCEGVSETGHNRTINRGRWDGRELRQQIDDPQSITAQVFYAYQKMLTIRREQPAFHPDVPQQTIGSPDHFFIVQRMAETVDPVVCVHNVSPARQQVDISALGPTMSAGVIRDVIGEEVIEGIVLFEPYQYRWLWSKR
jgi:sucrose phosphorylase